MRQVNFDVINFIVSSFLIIKKIIIYCVKVIYFFQYPGDDSNLLIVFYVQIMPDDFVMQLHRF